MSPATKTGIVTGAILKKNSTNCQLAVFAINRF